MIQHLITLANKKTAVLTTYKGMATENQTIKCTQDRQFAEMD